MSSSLQTVLDEREIRNRLGRFARIVDDRDWGAVGEVFADEVAFDYGAGGEQQGIEAMRANFRRYLDGCGASQHLIGSVMLEFEGERATTRAYVQARHQGIGTKAGCLLDSNGEYIDRWERRAGGWRIVRRDVRWFMLIGDMGVLRSVAD